MKDHIRLLSLPSTLLALIASATLTVSDQPELPFKLPAHVKYFPEDEHLIKRGLSAMEQMGKRAPTGVIKMPEDEDAMFFLDYWQFGEDESL